MSPWHLGTRRVRDLPSHALSEAARVRDSIGDVRDLDLERPLAPLKSIKLKLAFVIAVAVGVTVSVFWLALKVGVWPSAAGVLAAGAALGFVWFLSRGMVSPLREMAEAAEAMKRGDWSVRVTDTARDEIGNLARAFNAMASELAATDRVRRDLVANVSHELRTPIAALQVQLENLVDGVAMPDLDTFRVMLAQVERLGRLVQQLLDLSRLEAGTIPLERSRFAVEPLLAHAVQEQRLRETPVELWIRVEPEGLTADGDPERVHQVVANLLENAVRHTPEGGRVEV